MGYTRRRGARARGRARRHVHRRHGRADRGAARQSRALPARLAGRHGVRAGGEPRAEAARRARARGRTRRSSASPSTTASSCTGSTTRASSRVGEVELRAVQPAAGQFTVAPERRRPGDRREGRGRALRPAGLASMRGSRFRRELVVDDAAIAAARGRLVRVAAVVVGARSRSARRSPGERHAHRALRGGAARDPARGRVRRVRAAAGGLAAIATAAGLMVGAGVANVLSALLWRAGSRTRSP